MDARQWQEIKKILDIALEREGEARECFVRETRGANEPLYQEVKHLVRQGKLGIPGGVQVPVE